MTMAGSDIDSLVGRLAETKVENAMGLSFAGQGIKMDTEDDASPIVEAMKTCSTLQWLRLEGNTLGVVAAKAIAKALEKHPEFERAHWSDMFTGRLKSEIPDALRFLGNGVMLAGARLVELDLSDNAFGPNGMEGLVDFLSSESCFTLQELRLNNNGLGRTGGKMLAKSLLECHEKSSAVGKPLALRVFVSGRGRLENEGATCMAEAFKIIGTLEEVSMPQNGIFHEGITALASAFAQNPKLRKLDLNDNIFSEVGAKAMAKSLPKMTDLQYMNFGDCLIKTEGVQAFAQVMADSNPKLKEVVLSFNEIEMSGASAICMALSKKDSLIKLDLCGNELSRREKEKIEALMEASGRGSLLVIREDDDSEEEDDEDEEEDEESGEEETESLRQPDTSSASQLRESQPSEAVILILKIASVVSSDVGDVYDAACRCTDAVLKKTLEYGEENAAACLANEMLVHLGLLKSEDKKLVKVDNMKGALLVVSHAVRQSYFPRLAKDIFIAFFSRSYPSLDTHTALKQQVLQAIYQ